MKDLRARLIECFTAVFPSLVEQEILTASSTTLDRWDSMASATLIATIEEEFGVQVEADNLDQLVSFDSVLDFLRANGSRTRA